MDETGQIPDSTPVAPAQVASGCAAVVAELTDYLRYRSECGERTVELDNEAVSALFARRAPSPAAPHRTPLSCAPGVVPAPPDLLAIADAISRCQNCGLCRGRTKTVPGQGNAAAPDVMFVGEAPGADEDRQGLAFVGRAGQLLTKMIAAMGYTRDEVFIANICKCRPPENRNPTPEEMAACIPFLKRQIQLVRPKTIVALGNTACLGLLGRGGITSLRGKWTSFEGIPVMPTFHPAYLLRCPPAKVGAWADLKLVLARLGRPVPPPKPRGGASA